MDKISVVIPVYKVERYLDKCMNSLLNQIYKNLEIILVDDGSPDKCDEICDRYAQKYDNVLVVHKQNGGLSDARNFGLNYTTGGYIAFIDSDDYVDENYFEYLHRLIKQNDSDMSMCGFIGENEDGSMARMHTTAITENGCIDGKHALCKILYQEGFDVSAWGKLYKRELFNSCKYKVGIWYEDFEIIHKIVLQCKRVSYGGEQLYHYVQHPGSIMDKDKFEQRMLSLPQISREIREMYIDDSDLKAAVIWRDVYSNIIVLNRLIRTNENYEYQCLLIRHIKSDLYNVLKNRRISKKYKCAVILASVLPKFYTMLMGRKG